MTTEIRIIASAAVSVDGYIDHAGSDRLVLSSPEDWAEVLALRATCDAILVGAETIRRDNPSLATRTADLAAERKSRGQPVHPIKVTLTASGQLDRSARFFQDGDGEKIVFCSGCRVPEVAKNLSGVATVLALPDDLPPLTGLTALLAERGIASLLVEGGTSVLTGFLSQGLVDRLRLAVAPVFVGNADAPRLTHPARFPYAPNRRMALDSVRQAGDMAVMWFKLDRIVHP